MKGRILWGSALTAAVVQFLPGCASTGAAPGALNATPWEDVEKLPYTGWAVLSEQPRVLMRSRTSPKKVTGEKEWADGFVTELELKSEYDRPVKFDLEVKSPAGVVRCAPGTIALMQLKRTDTPKTVACELGPQGALKLTLLTADKDSYTLSKIRSYPWADLDAMAFSEPQVLSASPRVTMSYRVSNAQHGGDMTWPAGRLADIELANEAPFDVDFSGTFAAPDANGATAEITCDGTTIQVPSGSDAQPTGPLECVLRAREKKRIRLVLAKPDGFQLTDFRNRPPQGWVAFKDPSMAGIFWRGETSAAQTTVIPDDDPSKQSYGYEAGVAFFNARNEPALIQFVVVPGFSTARSMPDPTRHIGGGSVTLLGGEVKKISRASVVKEWTLWAAPRKSAAAR